MDRTCSHSRVHSLFATSSRNITTASGKRKTIMHVESLASKLIESLKTSNTQNPDSVHVSNTQNLATASEGRKFDYNSPAAGSDNTKEGRANNTEDSRTNNTQDITTNNANDFNCPSTRKREQKRAWHLIYENFKHGNFRTSPTNHLELLRKPSCEHRGWTTLSTVPKNTLDMYWKVKSESAMEEQERLQLARDSANIDFSDDELDSDSEGDEDDEDDFPHLYANIPTPSHTTTDNAKALLSLVKGPLAPPLSTNPRQFSTPSTLDIKRELALITALINDLGDRLIEIQEITDNTFFGALYNANPTPVLLSLKSFCSWILHPIPDQLKDALPPATQTVPDLRLIDSDGDVYSLEERIDILDEFKDRDFGRHLAERDEWQFCKERWFLQNCTDSENEARLQHLERWYEEGGAE